MVIPTKQKCRGLYFFVSTSQIWRHQWMHIPHWGLWVGGVEGGGNKSWDPAGREQKLSARGRLVMIYKLELNPISDLSLNARKALDQSEAMKQWEFSRAWPKVNEARGGLHGVGPRNLSTIQSMFSLQCVATTQPIRGQKMRELSRAWPKGIHLFMMGETRARSIWSVVCLQMCGNCLTNQSDKGPENGRN